MKIPKDKRNQLTALLLASLAAISLHIDQRKDGHAPHTATTTAPTPTVSPRFIARPPLFAATTTAAINHRIPSTSSFAQVGRVEAPHTASAAARTKTNRLVWEAIAKLENAPSGTASEISIPELYRFNSEGEIQLALNLDRSNPTDLTALSQSGFRVELALEKQGRVQGWAKPAAIDSIAQLDFVECVTLPSYAHFGLSGSVKSEGDSLLGVTNPTNPLPAGLDGSEIKIGIISDGVEHLADAIDAGELPAGVSIHPSLRGGGDEGTAMLEIVHDLAPGAELFFVGITSDIEMIEAFRWLSEEMACDVICDDVGFRFEPYFADGMVAEAAKRAIAAGSTCVTSAGNDAQVHYQGTFTDSGQTHGGLPKHDFKAGSSSDTTLDFDVPPGRLFLGVMQWDAAEQSNDDNLELLIQVGSSLISGVEVPGAEGEPSRLVGGVNTGSTDLRVKLIVTGASAGVEHTIELFGFGARGADDDLNPRDSIFGHAAADGVISCGAIDAADHGLDQIESFSSQGGSTIQFPSYEVRQTPTICAVDGVTVSGFGGFPSKFYGTSAASPHVAAIAALVLDHNPSLNPSRVRKALTDGAIDRHDSGYDPIFGHGLVDAPGAIAAASSPVAPSSKQRWLAAHYPPKQLEDPSLDETVWGDTADSDGDGLSNLIEYAMGLDPNTHNDIATGAPSVRASRNGLTLRFQQSTTATDVELSVEFSFDLKAWMNTAQATSQGITVNESVVSRVGSQEMVEVMASAPGNRRLFMRVRAN